MPLRRRIFDAEHEQFRELARRFFYTEVVPQHARWEDDGVVPRSIFCRMGDLDLLGISIDERHGGLGLFDYRFNVVLQEEAAAAGVTVGPLRTHLDVVVPYFERFANEEQRMRWMSGIAAGQLITAIALTEPDTGSDLAAVQTRAVRESNHYLLTGAKTYITGGELADLIVVLARTDSEVSDRRDGLTLLVVETDMQGLGKGGRLPKIGLKTQDTVELSFQQVRVPIANRLGNEGAAFCMLTENLPQERIAIAVGAVAQARAAVSETLDYVAQRSIFGRPLSQFQNTKFELAALATDVEAAQALLDNSVMALVEGECTPADAAMVKLFCTEMQGRVVDRCLQLFGGFGYITESSIARRYADARATRIYGGTSEVMKSIIAKSIGL